MTAVDLDALDAARAAALWEAIRDELAGWPIGSGYYSTTIGTDEAAELTDFLLAGSLAPLLADARKLRALREAVEGLAGRAEYRGVPVVGIGELRAVLAAAVTSEGERE